MRRRRVALGAGVEQRLRAVVVAASATNKRPGSKPRRTLVSLVLGALLLTMVPAVPATAQGNPRFHLDPYYGDVFGNDFRPNTEVTVTVDGDEVGNFTTDGIGNFGSETGLFDPRPGHVVTVDDGTTTKTHIVTGLTVADVDEETDTISGKAAPGSTVEIHVGEVGGSSDVQRFPTADGTGFWSTNVGPGSDPDPQNTIDLVSNRPGPSLYGGEASQCDEDNDCTSRRFPGGPHLLVFMDAQQIHGSEWALRREVTLEVDDTTGTRVHSATGTVENFGEEIGVIFILPPSFTVEPGFKVSMIDGPLTRTHTVTGLLVTEVNAEFDFVSGTAAPFAEVLVNIEPIFHLWRRVTADASGNWTADFSVPWETHDAFDIVVGTTGAAWQFDDEDNSTVRFWEAVLPSVAASITDDWINATLFAPDSPITIEIYDVDGTLLFGDTLLTDPDGSAFITGDIHGVDLQAGMLIRVADSSTVKELELAAGLVITAFDTGTDTLAGLAPASAETVVVFVFGDFGFCGLDAPVIGGEWEASFGGEPCFADLTENSGGVVGLADDDGDQTFVSFDPNQSRPEFLLIDEDAVSNGTAGILEISFNSPFCGGPVGGPGDPAVCINDDLAYPGLRTLLFTRPRAVTPLEGLTLPTGKVGDEGLFRFTKPDSQTSLVNGATFTIAEFFSASGAAADEANLDKIDGVAPLGEVKIADLVGKTVCAVVYDSDISVDVAAGFGNLQGATLGVTAFRVTAADPNPAGGSYLPVITVDLLPSTEVNQVCGLPSIIVSINDGDITAINFTPGVAEFQVADGGWMPAGDIIDLPDFDALTFFGVVSGVQVGELVELRVLSEGEYAAIEIVDLTFDFFDDITLTASGNATGLNGVAVLDICLQVGDFGVEECFPVDVANDMWTADVDPAGIGNPIWIRYFDNEGDMQDVYFDPFPFDPFP